MNNKTLGIYEYAIGNIAAAKQRFYNCAWLDVYNVTTHNDDLLIQGLNRPGYAILSDHEEIIQRYAKMRHVWRYIGRGDKEVVLSTEEEIAEARSVIWANTMQHFMANEDEMVERNLNVMEMKILSKKRVDGADRDRYQFFRFLLEQEKGKMEEVLEKIAKSKAYKIRGFDDPDYHFVAMPALGLAKLAWREERDRGR